MMLLAMHKVSAPAVTFATSLKHSLEAVLIKNGEAATLQLTLGELAGWL